jgi:hypothetical protein
LLSQTRLDLFEEGQYTYVSISLSLCFILLTTRVAKISGNPLKIKVAESRRAESPRLLSVINEYFEIFAVLLEIGIVILLWKTAKEFAEPVKVSKLQGRSSDHGSDLAEELNF